MFCFRSETKPQTLRRVSRALDSPLSELSAKTSTTVETERVVSSRALTSPRIRHVMGEWETHRLSQVY